MRFTLTLLLALALNAVHLSHGEDRVASWLSPRIINGIEAKENQFPYQVTLLYQGEFDCGGAILTSNYIVTAAHCVDERPISSLSVRAGSVYHNQGGQVIDVAEYIVYPDYDSRLDNHDIALVRLSSPLRLNNKSVTAIPLAKSAPPKNAEVTIVGWGTDSWRGPASEHLLFTKMKVIPDSTCGRIRPDHILCLRGDNTNGACRGDSGGAAVYEGTLVGVASYVFNGCSTRLPNVYILTSAYVDWLKSNSDL